MSAKVADGMAPTPRHSPNRELFGQGLANLVSPLFGGMPATGAIARTAVNVKAGARSRVAAIVHALVLLGVVFAASGLVSKIPLAALAGVLMVTAVRMVDIHNIRTILRTTRSVVLILATTGVVTVAFDLITAVEAGMAAAAVLALRQLALTSVPIAEPLPPLDTSTTESLRHDHIVAYRLDVRCSSAQCNSSSPNSPRSTTRESSSCVSQSSRCSTLPVHRRWARSLKAWNAAASPCS